MPSQQHPENRDDVRQKLLGEWLVRLNSLVEIVEQAARELGWSPQRMSFQIQESELGRYAATVIFLEHNSTKLILEPVARSTPGADGVVDLCRWPDYDDIARFFFMQNKWYLQYLVGGTPRAAACRDDGPLPLSKETLQILLNEVEQNAASTV